MFRKATDYAILLGLSMVFDAAVFLLKHMRPTDKRGSLLGDHPSLQ